MNKNNNNNSNKKKKKKAPALGYCTKHVRKCAAHNEYYCELCHKTDKQNKDLLIEVPKYKKGTSKQCTWGRTDKYGKKCPGKARGSYAKHNKKWHASTQKHFAGWKQQAVSRRYSIVSMFSASPSPKPSDKTSQRMYIFHLNIFSFFIFHFFFIQIMHRRPPNQSHYRH